jgi:hypothetical protein
MNISAPVSVLAGLLLSVSFVGGTAVAKPARAKKARRSRAPVTKVVELPKAHIEAINKKPGRRGGPGGGPDAVQPKDPGQIEFSLTANTPNVPYRGRLIGHYPREWRTKNDTLGPGGEVWLSQNRVPHGSYAVAELVVEAGREYEVTLCTKGGAQRVRATVGDVVHTFKSGDTKCDMALVLKPEAAGKASIKIDFADEPQENSPNAFAVLAVDVVRR